MPEIAGTGALEDTVNIGRRAAKDVHGIRPIGDERTFPDESPIGEDCREAVLCCQPHDQPAMHHGEGIGRNEQTAAGLGGELGDRGFDIGAGVDGSRLHLDGNRQWSGSERAQERV